MFNGVEAEKDYQISCVEAYGLDRNFSYKNTVLLPVISSAFGNSIEITWKYQDNYSAGVRALRKINGTIDRIFTTDVEYSDYYGRLYYYVFDIYTNAYVDEHKALGVNTANKYPLFTNGFDDPGVISVQENEALVLRKDGREALKFTYALHFVTDDNSYILGTALTNKNPFVTHELRRPHLYALPKKINRFADNIDISTAKDLGEVVVLHGKENSNHIQCNGKNSIDDCIAWAIAYEPSKEKIIFEDENGETVIKEISNKAELVIGKNYTSMKTRVVGGFYMFPVHDIYKYFKHLKNK